jgi:hypothetical protein
MYNCTGLIINGNINIVIIDLTGTKRSGSYILISKQMPPLAAMSGCAACHACMQLQTAL